MKAYRHYIIFSITILSLVFLYGGTYQHNDSPVLNGISCVLPPKTFQESDLVGTWTADYFGSSDKLIVYANHTYKQIFSSDTTKFESGEKKWWLESKPAGYLLLHLEGMRRCDDLMSICELKNGGLPEGEQARDPCSQERITYTNEVILFVTGSTSEVERDIVLKHARLVGSDWMFNFKLATTIQP